MRDRDRDDEHEARGALELQRPQPPEVEQLAGGYELALRLEEANLADLRSAWSTLEREGTVDGQEVPDPESRLAWHLAYARVVDDHLRAETGEGLRERYPLDEMPAAREEVPPQQEAPVRPATPPPPAPPLPKAPPLLERAQPSRPSQTRPAEVRPEDWYGRRARALEAQNPRAFASVEREVSRLENLPQLETREAVKEVLAELATEHERNRVTGQEDDRVRTRLYALAILAARPDHHRMPKRTPDDTNPGRKNLRAVPAAAAQVELIAVRAERDVRDEEGRTAKVPVVRLQPDSDDPTDPDTPLARRLVDERDAALERPDRTVELSTRDLHVVEDEREEVRQTPHVDARDISELATRPGGPLTGPSREAQHEEQRREKTEPRPGLLASRPETTTAGGRRARSTKDERAELERADPRAEREVAVLVMRERLALVADHARRFDRLSSDADYREELREHVARAEQAVPSFEHIERGYERLEALEAELRREDLDDVEDRNLRLEAMALAHLCDGYRLHQENARAQLQSRLVDEVRKMGEEDRTRVVEEAVRYTVAEVPSGHHVVYDLNQQLAGRPLTLDADPRVLPFVRDATVPRQARAELLQMELAGERDRIARIEREAEQLAWQARETPLGELELRAELVRAHAARLLDASSEAAERATIYGHAIDLVRDRAEEEKWAERAAEDARREDDTKPS